MARRNKLVASSEKVISILKQNGLKQSRQDGGDAIFTKPGHPFSVKVPVNRKNICIGTLKSIERQSGLSFR